MNNYPRAVLSYIAQCLTGLTVSRLLKLCFVACSFQMFCVCQESGYN